MHFRPPFSSDAAGCRFPVVTWLMAALGAAVAVWTPSPACAQTTTVQLPTFGVAIDADGVLSMKAFPDPTGQLQEARIHAARAASAPELQARSALRKISLVRLEAAIRQRLAGGEVPDETMGYLAGPTPSQAVCAVNAAWKGNRFIAVAGGGVSIRPHEALAPERLKADADGTLRQLRAEIQETIPDGSWWSD